MTDCIVVANSVLLISGSENSLLFFAGIRTPLFSGILPKSKAPRNAFALSPARHPAGNSFRCFTLPPPGHHRPARGRNQAGDNIRYATPPLVHAHAL